MSNITMYISSNIYSPIVVWKQGLRPVGRVALIPTSVYITNKIYRSIETLYADVFCLYGLFLYACFCRDEGNPTYGCLSLSARFYFMRILFNGAIAIAPYKHYNLTSFLGLLFFNVKITPYKKRSKR